MKKRLTIFLLIPVLLMAFTSCKKGELMPEDYISEVSITSSQLSTSNLTIQVNDADTRDTLKTGENWKQEFYYTGKEITEGKQVTINIYKAGTSELVADTTFLLPIDSKPTFKVIYNEEMKLGGFLSETGVPADSIRFRMVYHDNTAEKKYPVLNWSFNQSLDDIPYYDLNGNINISFPLAENELSGDITIPAYRKDDGTTSMYARLQVPETGKFLEWYTDASIFSTPFMGVYFGGNYYIVSYTLVDFPDGGPDCKELQFGYLTL
jgi:hypothetical protein